VPQNKTKVNGLDYITVVCDIRFSEKVFMSNCVFKLGLQNGQYSSFKKFQGVHTCDHGGFKKLINMERVSYITWLQDDYDKVYNQ